MKQIKITIIIMILLLTSGCYDRKEINSLGIVNSFVLDYHQPNVDIIAEVVNIKTQSTMGQNTGASLPYVYIKGTGSSILTAIYDMKRVLGNYIYLANLKSVFITEAYAKEKGLTSVLEELLRSYDTRQAEYLFVVKGTGNLYKSSSSLSDYIGDYIEKASTERTGFSVTVFKKVLDVVKEYYKEGKHVTLGVINQEPLTSEEETNINVLDNQKSGMQVKLEGLAIFKKNKLYGFLNGKDTELYNMIIANSKNGNLIPVVNETTFIINNLTSTTDIKYNNQKLTINIKLKPELVINNDEGKKHFAKVDTVVKLQKEFNQTYENKLLKFLNETQQKFGIDYFGFGEQLHISNPKLWHKLKKDWDKHYAKAKFKVDIDSMFVKDNKLTKSIKVEN